jgi:hypothetical protein
MWKYFTQNNTKVWVDVLPAFVKSYNNSTHRTIGTRPANVNEENKDEVWTRVYGYPLSTFPKPKFKVGDHVKVEVNIKHSKKYMNLISMTSCMSSRGCSVEIRICTVLKIRRTERTLLEDTTNRNYLWT